MKLTCEAKVKVMDGGIYVSVHWSGVELDRPFTFGWRLHSADGRLAERLAKAVNDQKVFVNPTVVYDVNGQSYVEANCLVMGRYMSADLRKLGY